VSKVDTKPDDKLTKAVAKLIKSNSELAQQYNETIDDINIDLCSTDEKGNIMKDKDGGFVFSKENMKERLKRIKSLDDKIVEMKTVWLNDHTRLGTLDPVLLSELDGVLYKPSEVEEVFEE
jgi:hypothetical protein